jgi:hypothetical protein
LLGKDGFRVRWEVQGFQGNGDESSFDEAYGRAHEEYSRKYLAAVLGRVLINTLMSARSALP